VDASTLEAALNEARAGRDRGVTLTHVLVSRGVIPEKEMQSWLHEVAEPPAQPGVANSAPGSMETQPQRVTWEVGSCVESYRLVDKLGQGAMGVVYLTEHVRTGVRYALKTLSFQADDDLRKRFLREGQAQALVDSHPNIVRVHSAGEAGGYLYLVMDLAAGGDLHNRLRRGPLPPLEAAAVVAGLARGLAHTHAHGVLHRDLKPANVLFDDVGTPMLVDFGLARVAGESSSLTRTGDLLGTPAYMGPEQATGLRGEVDERSDVYGLGAILYHCLTGQQPFTGASTIEVLSYVITEDPKPPRSLVKQVPKVLEGVCLRALAKAPGDRQQSAQDLANELQAVLDEASRATAGPANELETPKRSLALWPLIAASLVLGAGLIVFLRSRTGDEAPDAAAIAAREAKVSAARERREARKAQAPKAPLDSEGDPKPTDATLDRRIDRTQAHVPVEGERLRAGFTVTSRGTMLINGRVVELSETSMDMTLLITIVNVSQRAVTMAATIQHMKYAAQVMAVGSVKYDSQNPADAKSPFALALGKTFRVDTRVGTGEVYKVEGTWEIANQVLAKATERKSPALHLYAMDGFNNATVMRASLNKFFHLFPVEARAPGNQNWSFAEPVDITRDAANAAQDQLGMLGIKITEELEHLGVTRQVTVAIPPEVPEGLAFSYTGADSARKTSGRVVVRNGHVVSGKASETVELDAINSMTQAEQILVIESHYQFEEIYGFVAGDTVAAQWSDGHWYMGTVTESGDAYTVAYDDGSDQTGLSEAEVRAPLTANDIEIGDAVLADWRAGERLYRGTVSQLIHGGVLITWDDSGEARVANGKFFAPN
jgi:hypothetical protein